MTASPGAAQGGLVFGYSVDSPLHFEYLRSGCNGERLTVSPLAGFEPRPEGDPILTWTPSPIRPFSARLYQTGESEFFLWTSDAGWFGIDSEGLAITVPESYEVERYETRLWSVPTALCFMARGDVALHASAVQVGASALLFGAPGHFGKTTLAAGFLAAGHGVLAEDLSCFRPNPEALLLPGPAVLRVRPDTYANLEVPGARVVLEQEDRIHLAIDEGRRGDGSPVPIAGVVLIRPSAGDYRLRRVEPVEALRDVWALTLKLPNTAYQAHCFDSLAILVSSAPIWDLDLPMDYKLLPAVIAEVVNSCLTA